MRVLALDLGADWRGGQRQTRLVAAGLAGRGHTVQVFALRDGPLAREVARDGLAVAPAPSGSEFFPALLFALVRAVRAFAPDVLYAGDGRSHGAAVWSGVARRHPLVVHRRVAFPPGRGLWSRLKYRAPRRYLAVSGAVKEALLAAGIPGEKVAVLADGLPPEAFLAKETPAPPPFRLAHVGAFDGMKGQETVIGTLALLAAEGRDVTALFLGDGPMRGTIEAFAARRGVGARCVFAGVVDDVSSRLAGSHLLLLPSQSEGAALAITEAMAAGCAVAAHDVGGSAEMLEGGVAGRLVRGLDEETWAAAVRELIDDPTRRAALVEAGRRAAGERTLERAVTAIETELVRAAEDS